MRYFPTESSFRSRAIETASLTTPKKSRGTPPEPSTACASPSPLKSGSGVNNTHLPTNPRPQSDQEALNGVKLTKRELEVNWLNFMTPNHATCNPCVREQSTAMFDGSHFEVRASILAKSVYIVNYQGLIFPSDEVEVIDRKKNTHALVNADPL